LRYSQKDVSEEKPQSGPKIEASTDPFACFHPVTAAWFQAVFDAPTAPQRLGWPVIARGENALIMAPTGTGKTLAALLWCLDRLMLGDRDRATPASTDRSSPRCATPAETEGPRDQENAAKTIRGFSP